MSAQTAPTASQNAIIAAASKGLTGNAATQIQAFAAAFYARLPEEELALRSAQQWASIALSSFAFIQKRPAGVANIRVFNPQQASDGFETSHTVIHIVNDDMPFLVDSVSMVLSNFACSLHTLVHPVMPISRDASGQLTAIDSGKNESLIYLEIDRQASTDDMEKIREAIATALSDVRESVADWQIMRDKMNAIADEMATRPMPATASQRSEAQDFLRWAADNHFTFLGYREYEVATIESQRMLTVVPNTGLGLMRGKDADVKPRPLAGLAAADLPAGATMEPLILTKTNARSTVHRAGYMDYIGVLVFDESGKAIREQRFLGLYTSSAYKRRPWEIPLVRQRHEAVMEASGLGENSHSGKALRHILETLPRDELFQANTEELSRTCMGILALQERVRPKLFLRRDPFGRFYSALVYIPRDRFSTEVRERIEALFMRELKGERLDTNIQIGESPLAQLHLTIRPKSGEKATADTAMLEAELLKIVRNFQDELRDLLVQQCGEEKGLKLANRYGRALPTAYLESVSPVIAAEDVQQADMLENDDQLRLNLYRSPDDNGLRFKLVRLSKEIALSDALPMLENLGLRINSEHPYELNLDEGRIVIQDFEVEPTAGTIEVENS
jgi:glutamate dehydrogenase